MRNKQSQFQEIVDTYQEKVYRLCKGFYPDNQDVDDLYQEIWIKVWLKLDQFRGDANVGTWIYRLATNTSITHKQKDQKQKQLFINNEVTRLNIQETSTLQEKREQEKQLEQLYTVIHQLPDIERIIISMVLENHSYQTIADVTGLTLNYVGVKVNRIKASIKKRLVPK